jgi:hypothetical protein
MNVPQTMPQPAEQTTMVSAIERMVRDPSISMERLEQMLAMKERLDAKAAEQAFNAAFAKMQAALPVIPERGQIKNKDRVVQSTYPLWEDVNAAIRGPLADNDLGLSFDRRKEDGKTIIGCIVTHAMGHSRRAEIDLPRDESGSKNAVQGEGSTVSYGQRYSSKMLLNWISEGSEDDDGKKAGAGNGISAEQFLALRDLLDQSGADEGRFLAHFKIATLDDMPLSRLGEADKMLRAKLAQKAGA